MGCDIHMHAEKRDENGQWVEIDLPKDEWETKPFENRNYGVFNFFAGVRAYSGIVQLSDPRGLPDDVSEDVRLEAMDWGGDGHSHSWLSVAELNAVDYDQVIEDRRVTRQIAPGLWHGGQTCEVGEGRQETLREFLGDFYMNDLRTITELGAERIVFWFDN